MTFLVNEQNVPVMYIDINAISLCLDLNIFQQDECFCSKLGMEEEYAKFNLKTSLSLIWVICELYPFVRVGQYIDEGVLYPTLSMLLVGALLLTCNQRVVGSNPIRCICPYETKQSIHYCLSQPRCSKLWVPGRNLFLQCSLTLWIEHIEMLYGSIMGHI